MEFKHSNIQTFKPSNLQTFKLSNIVDHHASHDGSCFGTQTRIAQTDRHKPVLDSQLHLLVAESAFRTNEHNSRRRRIGLAQLVAQVFLVEPRRRVRYVASLLGGIEYAILEGRQFVEFGQIG